MAWKVQYCLELVFSLYLVQLVVVFFGDRCILVDFSSSAACNLSDAAMHFHCCIVAEVVASTSPGVLIGAILLVPWLWCFPVALVTAELSTAYSNTSAPFCDLAFFVCAEQVQHTPTLSHARWSCRRRDDRVGRARLRSARVAVFRAALLGKQPHR